MHAVDLLEQIGRNCVGAIQLLPVDAQPPDIHRIDAEALTHAQVERLLDQTISEPAPGMPDDQDLRTSIAGAQEKTALLWHQNQWCKPLGPIPTTHIFKLPLGGVGGMRADFSTSVENEWLCAEIIREFGQSIANSQITLFRLHKSLVVERFDRRMVDNTWWARLPQEDFCQVLGIASEKKYEERDGPKMFQWQKVKLAMAVRANNAHYRMAHIQRRHWNEVAKSNGVGSALEPVMHQFITQIPRVLEAVSARLPAGFPTGVSEPIFNGLFAQTKRLG